MDTRGSSSSSTRQPSLFTRGKQFFLGNQKSFSPSISSKPLNNHSACSLSTIDMSQEEEGGINSQDQNNKIFLRSDQKKLIYNNYDEFEETSSSSSSSFLSCSHSSHKLYDSSDALFESLIQLSLEKTHGILHASGLRRFCDIRYMTYEELLKLNFNSNDFDELWKCICELKQGEQFKIENLEMNQEIPKTQRRTLSNQYSSSSSYTKCVINKSLPTPSGLNVFQIPYQKVNFKLESISNQYKIYKGRFFNVEQCLQLLRMAELYAYKTSGWRPEIYTLTNLDLHVKSIPGMLDIIHPFMDQLMEDVHVLFDGCHPGSTRYRNDNEPHLVKYTGKTHKGVCMHTDSADITVNIALSDPRDYVGGGTYFEDLDQTIVLEQGEMLLHKGDLKHQGMDITSGIRTLLVSFFSCKWDPSISNKKNQTSYQTSLYTST